MKKIYTKKSYTKKFSRDPIFNLRKKIDRADKLLIQALSQRFKAVDEIGKYKVAQNIALVQASRWKDLLKDRVKSGKEAGLNPGLIKAIYELIHIEALDIQNSLTKKAKNIKSRIKI